MGIKKISLCGLICSECPAYLAHKTNNNTLRIETARRWSRLYKSSLKPKDINCLGCLSQKEPLFVHCRECGVRKCGLSKKIINCGMCKSYKKCKKIISLHQMIPEGKKTCDENYGKYLPGY